MSSETFRRVAAQQHALHEDIGRLHAWSVANPEASGGYWLDNSLAERGTGLVQMVLGVVRGTDVVLPENIAHREQLRVMKVANSEVRLRRVADAIRGWGLPGVSGVGAHITSNRVRLYLAAADEPTERRLTESFGADTLDIQPGIVIEQAC